MSLLKQTTTSTNDVPQRDNIVVAQGRHAEWSRLLAASAVVVGFKVFDNMLPQAKVAERRNRSFRLRAL